MGKILIFDNLVKKLYTPPKHSYIFFGDEGILKEYDSKNEFFDLLFHIRDMPVGSFFNDLTSLTVPVIDPTGNEEQTKRHIYQIYKRNPRNKLFFVNRDPGFMYKIEEDRVIIQSWDQISEEKTYEFAGEDFKKNIERKILELDKLGC